MSIFEMQKHWIVCDGEGYRCVDDSGAQIEFLAFQKAVDAAEKIAVENPGDSIGIYELVGEMKTPVGDAELNKHELTPKAGA